ncbi:LNS2 domain-containing protein [Lutispora saccharofermentans]|uniref:Uncharacterized protein n=1 Tax=Lutispora saccharofermentans TaxID=3024236 RepID=A0ABT1NFM8_9FIRM|nr:hypothetical protein [Lutispora saccharofermentans]MCQ1530057.1 hypothetical protein [Lutispora saccharofermentans]
MDAILIFIDGTICDTRHRHHLFGTSHFYSESQILKDLPTSDSVKCLKELSQKYKIIYIGARPNCYKDITKKWINETGFPDGNVYLSENQSDRLKIAKKLKEQYNIIAGIGDRWDDNEMHLEIGCISIILKEFEGDWNTVRKYLLKQ